MIQGFVDLAVAVASPLGIMLVLLIGGGFASAVKPRSKGARRMVYLGLGLCVVYTFSPLAELALGSLERPFAPLIDPDPDISFVVVLSGYGREDRRLPVTSRITQETMCRLSEGIRIHRLLPRSRLVLSGGVLRRGEEPIAATMADFVVAMGVPRERTIIEGESTNTYENLVEVRSIVGTGPFVLVTSAGHLRRALGVARKLAMAAVPAPACIQTLSVFPRDLSSMEWVLAVARSFAHPSTGRLVRLQWVYHEYLGYLWYQWLGRL